MRITLDPAAPDWPAPGAARVGDLAGLRQLVDRHAARLGAAPLAGDRPIIGTGHQAWLWHPGILAKDLAMVAAAERYGAEALHLVVDQDAHEAVTLTLPRQAGDRLDAVALRLAHSTHAEVPTGFQPPVDAERVLDQLRAAGDAPGLAALAAAFSDGPAARTLAEQLTAVLLRLMRPYTGPVPVLFTSDLPRLAGYRELVAAMLRDARRCVQAYNEAVAAVPEAGLTPLAVEPDRVELPLWAAGWQRPRRRVFADLADSTPIFTDEQGEPLAPPPDANADNRNSESTALLPRALLLTAFMRSRCCDLFIHGTGGGLYDRATDRWWQTWRHEALAPAVVVSADVHLPPFDVPLATVQDVARARWRMHHAPYNVDRLLGLDGPLAQEKRRVLATTLARPAVRRAGRQPGLREHRQLAFRHLRRINAYLASRHPGPIDDARAELDRARLGLHNATVARRRDWPFAVYPPAALEALRDEIGRRFAMSGAAPRG
ncbi:MAG: hypothetical protein WD009_14910 [Phycisphaeraceae bacterium]